MLCAILQNHWWIRVNPKIYTHRRKEIDGLQWGASKYLGAQFKRDVFFDPTGIYNG